MKYLKLILSISIILLLCTSCEKNQEGDWATYYKTIGEGYIWDGTNDKPLTGAPIIVTTVFEGGWRIFEHVPHTKETFTTDENGFYQIRFMKRGQNKKVEHYSFKVGAEIGRAHV